MVALRARGLVRRFRLRRRALCRRAIISLRVRRRIFPRRLGCDVVSSASLSDQTGQIVVMIMSSHFTWQAPNNDENCEQKGKSS